MTDAPLILAIESATSRVGCALGTSAGVLGTTFSERPRRHAESLAPQIEFVLAQAGVGVGDIDLLAVDVGPGLYTGLRVGITTARAMAHALDIAVIGVSSLDAVGHAARHLADDLVVALDARRGEVFHADVAGGRDLSREPAPLQASEGRVIAPEALIEELVGRDCAVVGDGAAMYADVFAAAGLRCGPSVYDAPDPAAVLAVATQRVADARPASEVAPLYLRRPDAVAKWDKP